MARLPFSYVLTRKDVKNINCRIKRDGVVYVSANKKVPVKVIEDFLYSKSDYIMEALEKIEQKNKNAPVPIIIDEEQITILQNNIEHLARKYFLLIKNEKENITFPTIKYGSYKSMWGNYNKRTNVMKFSINLISTNNEFIEYVVLHEFCHMVYLNHQKEFYKLVEKYMPNYKQIRRLLWQMIKIMR